MEQEKLRVSYRFDAETVQILQMAQASDNPLYSNRPMTWLLQHAVKELYGSIADKQADINGDSK